MCIKFLGFFLFEAICNASICESPPHPFVSLYSQAFDNSTPSPAILSRREKDGNLLETSSLLPRQFFSMSKGLLSSRLLAGLSAIMFLIVVFVFPLTLPAARVLVLVLVHPPLFYYR